MGETRYGMFFGSRSYRTFPVFLRPEDEAEGAGILREFPNPTGVMLFGALRDVMLWLLTPNEMRRALFPAGSAEERSGMIASAEIDEDLRPFLVALAALTAGPLAHSEADVAAICRECSMWAAKKSAPLTELAFTQASAIAEPDTPSYSLFTARLARDTAQFARADTWFRHTIKQARLKRDWSVYVDGFLGLGTCYLRVGNGPAARTMYERALKTAKRWRLRTLAGAAHHDLFHVCADAGELRRAYDHARAAYHAYGNLEGYLTRLAADLASLWVKLGSYGRAVPVFKAIIDQAPNKTIRALRCANLVRAAAFGGMRQTYEEARQLAMTAVREAIDPVRIAECYAIIAISDNAMSEWDRAVETGEEARRRASVIGAAEVEIKAAEAVEIAKSRNGISLYPSPQEETPGLARFADNLAHDLAEAFVR